MLTAGTKGKILTMGSKACSCRVYTLQCHSNKGIFYLLETCQNISSILNNFGLKINFDLQELN